MKKTIDKKIQFLQKSKETNEKAIVYLSDELLKKRLAIFVGAGCSVAIGLPPWTKLIFDIQLKFKIQTKEKDLLRIAAKIEKEIGALPFREEIAERIKTHPHSPEALHKSLISLDTNLFITTNYDSVLEDALRKEGIAPAVIMQDRDIPSIIPVKKTVVKLHGDINSPTSIIITSNDYLRYNLEHSSFNEWLRSKAVQNTLLFVGTSFTDQRLRDADEYVLKRFGDFRRAPCIFLKFPEKRPELSDDDYLVEIADFEILCEEFKSKGFYVLIIENYDEIVETLNNLNSLVLQKKLQETPADFVTQITFKTIQVERLEKDLADICDEKVKEICNKVWGDGCMPTQAVMKEQADVLSRYLNDKNDVLNDESKLEGFITLTDVSLNLERKGYISEARKYYDKANAVYQKIKNQSKWKERFARITAKILLFEGKVDESIGLVSHSKDDKTISFWLTLLIDTEKYEMGYDFIVKNEIKIPWLPEALYILVMVGKVNEAEKKYNDFFLDFDEKKKEKSIATSLYKNEHFYDKVCAFMADAYFRRALKSTGKTDKVIYAQDIDSDGKILCQKSVESADRIFSQPYGESIKNSLKDYYFAYRALITKMQAVHFLGDYKSADKAAEYIVSVRPVAHEVAEYVASRGNLIEKNIVESIVTALSNDYPEQSWALLIMAFLQIQRLNDTKNAWENAKRVLELTSDDTEKERAAGIIFDIGNQIKKQEESQKIIYAYLSPDSLWRKYLEAGYQESKGNSDEALKLISEIEAQNPPPHLQILCKYRHALEAIKKGEYQIAEQLLGESQRIYSDQFILRELLKVQMKLENDKGAFETAEKLEKFGISDNTTMYYKAITARNLGYYAKSEQAWDSLVKNNPQDPELAYGYAEVLAVQEKYNEAIDMVNKFIKCDKELNLKCLRLAAYILRSSDKEKNAFEILDNCFEHFQDDSALLLEYVDLGFRIGEEEKAHKALMRLEQLKQAGKIQDQVFRAVSLDEIKDMVHRRYESRKKLCEQYSQGKALRYFFSSFFNIPLYLDWAYRTQPLAFLPEGSTRAEFTTYSTNGFRVEKNKLIPIAIPSNIRNIVIDYTALITLHQLGLIPKLIGRFDAIYYPDILHLALEEDKQKYKPVQASQEEIYRNLEKKFDSDLIKYISVPDSHKDTEVKLAIRLAEAENLPLVSAYLEKEEIPEHSSVIVIRFHQILSHLYEKGRIREARYLELKKIIQDKVDITTSGLADIFDSAVRLVFDEITLELAERYDLIDLINEAGFKIIVEKTVWQSMQRKIREGAFFDRAAQWQKELLMLLKDIKKGRSRLFIPEHVLIREETQKKKNLHIYDILTVETFQIAERKELSLLVDDRFIQMQIAKHPINKQFGSDALLQSLFEEKILSLEEYSQAFLKLCEWRYRFLVPTSEIIIFFALEYKNNLLGKPLEALIKYSNECMKDNGLFLGREPTIPPTLCGVKFYMQWVNVWIDALIKIWTDPAFSQEKRDEITKQVFLRAFPQGPQGLRQDIRSNITAMTENSIIQHLFIGIIGQKNPVGFKKLLDHAFDSLGFSNEKRIDTLIFFLKKGIKDNFNKDLGKIITLQMLRAFYGDLQGVQIDERLIPYLQEFDVGISRKKVDDSSSHPTLSEGAIKDIVGALSEMPTERAIATVEDFKTGPLIFIPPSEKKGGELLVLHDLIGADSIEIRKTVANELLDATFISGYTKKIVKDRYDNIVSEKPFVWPLAAREICDALLKDFLYAQHMLKQLSDQRISSKDRQAFIRMALKSALEPAIESIISSLPLLLDEPFDKGAIGQRIEKKIQENDDCESILSWYLNNAYFVPYISQRSVYGILKNTIGNISSREILELTKKWVENFNKEDHLAWLLILEIVLNARADAKGDEQSNFTNKEFYDFLDAIFERLLFANKPQNNSHTPEIALMQSIWSLRRELAIYYLRYLDLNMHIDYDDERKVALAWWMARETVFSITKSGEKLTSENKTTYISSILKNEQNVFSLMQFRHHFINAKPSFTASRYLTINKADLLSYAVCALFAIAEDGDIESNNVLKGLRLPMDALNPHISNTIMNKLAKDIWTGNSQIPEGSKILGLHWNVPLCKSVPGFFKKYYGEAIGFLGEKVSKGLADAEKVCDLAKFASAKNFLTTELPKLSEYIKGNQQPIVTMLISSLKVFLLSHEEKEYPNELDTFKKDNTILRQTCGFELPLASSNCGAFSEILLFLQIKRNLTWTPVFCEQFKNIDYLLCDDEINELIISYLLIFVLIGGDYAVLTPILNANKADNRKVRDILKRMAPVLESFLSYVPLSSRENFRRILNDLS